MVHKVIGIIGFLVVSRNLKFTLTILHDCSMAARERKFMLWFSLTLGTIWYFPLFQCMVIYSNVHEAKETTKLYQG